MPFHQTVYHQEGTSFFGLWITITSIVTFKINLPPLQFRPHASLKDQPKCICKTNDYPPNEFRIYTKLTHRIRACSQKPTHPPWHGRRHGRRHAMFRPFLNFARGNTLRPQTYSIRQLASANDKTSNEHGLRIFILGAVSACVGGFFTIADHTQNHSLSYGRPSRSSYKYLICGGGVAAQEALSVFIERGEANDLLVVSPEWSNSRYCSTDLAKQSESSSGVGVRSSLVDGIGAMIPFSFFSSRGQSPEIVIGPRVMKIDASRRVAILDDATEITFEKCLIAVGSTIPDIPIGKIVSREAASLVSGVQTKSDWKLIDSVIQQGKETPLPSGESRAHLTIVGGGWMSTVVGAVLVDRGVDVTFSYAEPAFLARYFPKYMAHEVLSRLMWGSGGGVDSLSYAAVRYVIARKPLEESFRPIEAEVHVGTVFDAFSIIDFRTDHLVFAPTLSPVMPIEVPSAVVENGGFVVNSELMVASDVYAAGGALCVNSGAFNYPEVMRWSADHAKSTGRHAALNVLGAREPYSTYPSLTVDLEPLCLSVHILGDVDGSSETFGYFVRNKEKGQTTCGGQLEIGALFCVAPAPLSHRGATQKLVITGIALWEGSTIRKIPSIESAKLKAQSLLQLGAMHRPELESVMDEFAKESLGIFLFPEPPAEVENEVDCSEGKGRDTRGTTDLEEKQEETTRELRPLTELRKPIPGIIWRRHRSARIIPVRRHELLWAEDGWLGAASGETKADKHTQAHAASLKRARQS